MAYLLLVELFSERGLLILQGTWVQEIFTSWPICQGITKAAFFSVGQSQTKDENDCWRLTYNVIYLPAHCIRPFVYTNIVLSFKNAELLSAEWGLIQNYLLLCDSLKLVKLIKWFIIFSRILFIILTKTF